MHYQAKSIGEIAQATVHTEALDPDDPFFTDFTGLRGLFREYVLFRALRVDPTNFSYDYKVNRNSRVLVFLAGMRGAGKSTELRRYMRDLERPNGYYCVFCSIDTELDSEYLEYSEILIHQMEKLIEKIWADGIQLDDDVVTSLNHWFQDRLRELNILLGENAVDLEVNQPVGWMNLLELLKWIRAVIFNGSVERAGKIRMVFNNRFTDFAQRFNRFVAEVSQQLRQKNLAQDILFIIDGLEKTKTTATRRRIILEESNRIRSIKANMLFTLPIDLMQEIKKIREDAEVITFPFIKVRELDGTPVETAIERFTQFIYLRITPELFENEGVVREAILFSGGSPRELLRLLQYASYEIMPQETFISRQALLRGVEYLSADARLLDKAELEILKVIKENNEQGIPTPYLEGMQRLLENVTIMEYNDGNYKRVNPIIEYSQMYRHYVG